MNKRLLLEKLNKRILDINNGNFTKAILEDIAKNEDKYFGYEEFNELFGFEEYYQLRISKLENENVFVYVPIKPEIIMEGDKLFIKHFIEGSILSKPTVKELLNNGRILFFICTGEKDDDNNWIEEKYRYYYFGELFIHHIKHPDNGWDLYFSYKTNPELWKNIGGLETLQKVKVGETEENQTVVNVKNLIVNDENYKTAEKLKDIIRNGVETGNFNLCEGLNDRNVTDIINTDAYNLLINEELFHTILDPFPTGPVEVYVKIDTEEDTEEDAPKGSKKENNTVLLVKNENMRAIDNCFYGEGEYRNRSNSLDYIYKPYIYKMHLKESRIEKPNTWYKVPISFSEADGFTKDGSRMLLVASPSEEKEVCIDWKGLTEVQNVLNNSNNQECVTSEIESNLFLPNAPEIVNSTKFKLDSIFAKSLKIKIYKIGQANMICCTDKKGKIEIAFDFGIPITKNIESSGSSNDYSFISNYRPSVVFISHWHSDHFEGLYYLNKDFWQDDSVVFIAPKVSDREKEFDLVKYLIKSNKLIQINNYSQDYSVYSYNDIKLFFGKGKGNDTNELNSRGLLLQLNKTLLPGDCNMEYWPDDFGKDNNGNYIKYESICIPHHGASGCINDELENYISDDVCFYLCCGYNNEYKHPNKNEVNKLNRLKHISGFTNKKRAVRIVCTNIYNPLSDVKMRCERKDTRPFEFDD